MNQYFIDKVENIRAKIPQLPNNYEKCHEIMKNRMCSLDLQHVTIQKVAKIIKGLKPSKSTGLDGLDSYSLKVSADIISPPLHHIICLSIMQSRFPSQWKNSKVIPLHKKDCKLDCKNYRPVAILSPLSKILERIIYDQLYGYFDKNDIFNSNLHGFRRNRSTQTALLTMYDRWVRAASIGHVSGVVLIDLSAAFDLVDHNILLNKLRIYGVKDEFLRWIESYLCDRNQSVWIDHVLSTFLACKTGVPQGSILGPLFFLIFANDLPACVQSQLDSYADDTTVTVSGKTLLEVEEKLNTECTVISNWMKANLLKLNADKTHSLIMGTQKRLTTLGRPLEIQIDGVVVESEKAGCENLLGCRIQGNLKWNSQISLLTAKLNKRLSALSQLRYCCPFSIRKAIADGIFGSILVYCLPLYGGLDKTSIQNIQILQNKAARIVCCAPLRARRSELFEKLGWLTVNQLIAYHTLVTIQKIRSTKEPKYLASYLTTCSRNGRIVVPNELLNVTRNSFCFRGPIQWNLLPVTLKAQCNIGLFKKELKNWIRENVQRFL